MTKIINKESIKLTKKMNTTKQKYSEYNRLSKDLKLSIKEQLNTYPVINLNISDSKLQHILKYSFNIKPVYYKQSILDNIMSNFLVFISVYLIYILSVLLLTISLVKISDLGIKSFSIMVIINIICYYIYRYIKNEHLYISFLSSINQEKEFKIEELVDLNNYNL